LIFLREVSSRGLQTRDDAQGEKCLKVSACAHAGGGRLASIASLASRAGEGMGGVEG